MNSEKITEVLDVLVGSTNPIGVTEYDEEVIENIQTLIDISKWIFGKFEEVLEDNEGRKEGSRVECYELVFDYVNQYCR